MKTLDRVLLKPEYIFIILSVSFGLLITLVTPPFQVPDEYLHFDYAYAISKGQLMGATSDIPLSLQQFSDETQYIHSDANAKISYERLLQFIRLPLNSNVTVPTSYSATAKYNPLPYFPVAFSIVIARFLDFNPFDLFYFGRIFNLLFWITCGYIAIKKLPAFKWAFLMILLTPMSLFEAGSYSADVFLNAISALWFSVCLNYTFIDKNSLLANKSKTILFILGILLSLTKPPYILLLGLFFLIPQSRFGTPTQYKKIALVFLGTCLILFVISLFYASNDASISSTDSAYNLKEQLNYLLANPLQFPIIILRSVKYLIIPYWYSSIGLLGWLDVLLPTYIYVTYPIVFLFICLIDQSPVILISIKQKLLAFLSSSLALFTILFSLYLTWTPIGDKTINGFQGRYLIPLFPTLILLFNNRFTSVSKSWKAHLVTAYLFIALCLTVRAIILRYYIA